VFCDKVTRTWKQIIYHHQQHGSATAAHPAPVPVAQADADEREIPEVTLAGLVRDERGVRLARTEESD
jgi:hypothetical protein